MAERAALPLSADTPHGYLAKRHLAFLNDFLPERIAFSYRELEAAEWIVETLLGMGYTWADIAIQEFSMDDGHYSPRIRNPMHFFDIGSHALRHYSQNIILTLPGQRACTIIVGAHYDSLLYPGASDNASGVALLLESAQRMRELEPDYTIIYIFFGAEEVNLLGAFYYLAHLAEEMRDNIVLMINADVLFDGDTLVYAAGYRTASGVGEDERTRQVDRIAEDLNDRHDFGLTPLPNAINLSSDNMPFVYAGYTVLVLFGAEVSDGRFSLTVFHSARDDLHYLNANMPDRIPRATQAFSVFLEEVLLST